MVPHSSCHGKDLQVILLIKSTGSMGLRLNMSKGLVGLKGSREAVLIKAKRLSGMTIIRRRALHYMSLVEPIPFLHNDLAKIGISHHLS